jgi:L-fuculose-phosphate aldolase
MSTEAEFLKYVHLLYLRGHLTLLSGNVSMRVGDEVLITPTSRPKPFLTPEELVWIDLDGRVLRGSLKPTSEWRMHVAIYRRRPDVGAVVHTHDVLPTVLADGIDPSVLSEAEAYLGSGIAVVPYIQPGTAELAEAVASALERSNVAVLKRHGLVAVGRDLAEAVNRIEVVADLANATFYAAVLSAIKRGLNQLCGVC